MYLQANPGKNKIQNIADAYKISKNHLSVAANKLSELGYIISSPGPKGGIEFNQKTASTKLGNLISQIEDLEIVECFDPETNTCILSPSCSLKLILDGATKAFIKELQKYKVSDLKSGLTFK